MTAHVEGRGAARARKTAETKPRPFGAIVRDLLIERDFVTGMGNPNWSGFAAQLEDVNYESLRKAVTGDRHPAPKIMEAVAASLGVDPSIFWEYRLYEAQEQFDPKVVGEEQALANLQAWAEAAR
jgi:hypothetical protein